MVLQGPSVLVILVSFPFNPWGWEYIILVLLDCFGIIQRVRVTGIGNEMSFYPVRTKEWHVILVSLLAAGPRLTYKKLWQDLIVLLIEDMLYVLIGYIIKYVMQIIVWFFARVSRRIWLSMLVDDSVYWCEISYRILIRPHPAIWRLVHGMAVIYLVALTFLLFQVGWSASYL